MTAVLCIEMTCMAFSNPQRKNHEQVPRVTASALKLRDKELQYLVLFNFQLPLLSTQLCHARPCIPPLQPSGRGVYLKREVGAGGGRVA